MHNSQLIKSILIKLLDSFVAICESNGLKYYLSYGSLIGAVRNKGMIPWDDDIDLLMPRVDYEKLQRLPDSVWGENCRLSSWRKTKDYRYDFLKVESLDTTLLERIHPDYVGGLFIDIFPLDCYPSNDEFVNNVKQTLSGLLSKYVTCSIKHDCECKSIMELLALKVKRLFYNHKNHIEKFEIIASTSGERGEMVADFHNNCFYSNGGWPIEWFGEGAELEFEGKLYRVPSRWDDFLTHIYGDYMTPPPLEKRCAHVFEYIDFEKRRTKSELRDEFKRIHHKYAYRFSVKKEVKWIVSSLSHE